MVFLTWMNSCDNHGVSKLRKQVLKLENSVQSLVSRAETYPLLTIEGNQQYYLINGRKAYIKINDLDAESYVTNSSAEVGQQ